MPEKSGGLEAAERIINRRKNIPRNHVFRECCKQTTYKTILCMRNNLQVDFVLSPYCIYRQYDERKEK